MTSGFLLDTNVPSELTRIKPDSRVVRWLQAAEDNLLFLSVISIGEFYKGFTVHPEHHRRAGLHQWLENTLRPWFEGRILSVSEAIAERWGVLEGQCQLKGLIINAPDGLITRNVKDFVGLGVEIFNLWVRLRFQPHLRQPVA